MKSYTIKHSLRKNLPTGTLYNSQVATIIFVLGMSFKLSAAPGIISTDVGSSTLWVFIAYSILDIACITALLAFSRMGGDAFLMLQNSTVYRLVCGIMSVLLTLKATFFFCYISAYLTHELFTGIEPYLLYVVFLLPVVYLGIKGQKTIARCCELFFVLFISIIIFNLVFIDTDLDFGRNLPVFSIEPVDFFKNLPRYGLWLNDFLPLAFIRIKNKKLPYVTCSIAITWTLINLIVLLGVAIYGDALKMVADLLIHLASFNQLTLEIGRMEWTNIFSMLIMSIFSLSFLFSGAIIASERAIKTNLPAKFIFPLALICPSIFVPSARTVSNFSLGWFGYILFSLSIFIPIALVGTFAYHRLRYKGWYKYFDEEYIVNPLGAEPDINSLATGILKGYQLKAEQEEDILPNGKLQPKGEE